MISILKKIIFNQLSQLEKNLIQTLHQAMMEIEDENNENGIILQEIKKDL